MEKVSKLTDVVNRLPQSSDQDEIRIVRLIQQELLSSAAAKEMFSQSRQELINFFKTSLVQLAHPELIYQATQETLGKIARLTNSQIVTGQENLSALSQKTPVLAAVNHLGSYKLVEIKPAELGLKLPIDVIHPFPIYYAPLYPVGQILEDELFEAHVELPDPLFKIQQAAELIIVPPASGTLFNLQTQTKKLIDRHPNALITVFPEGGTTGKRNSGGPYDLEEFKTGAFVIAANLGIPLLPIGQYFNPQSGFEIGILPAVEIKADQDRQYYVDLANQTRSNLQEWLNSRQLVATVGIEPTT